MAVGDGDVQRRVAARVRRLQLPSMLKQQSERADGVRGAAGGAERVQRRRAVLFVADVWVAPCWSKARTGTSGAADVAAMWRAAPS